MSVLFISDLHLSPEKPEIAHNLMGLLQQAHTYEHIYILGDLFDFWLGDDAIPEALQPLIQSLQALSAKGIPTGFIQGNRDFLVGEGFMQQTGCQLLPEAVVVEHYSHRILIMHGDTLCTDDIEYQQFRQYVRDPERQRQFLALPLAERIQQAKAVREDIRSASKDKADDIMDVNQATVEAEMNRHDVQYLIHGHTHRPAIHSVAEGWRAVLGDWHPEPSWLTLDAQGVTLHDPRINNKKLRADF